MGGSSTKKIALGVSTGGIYTALDAIGGAMQPPSIPPPPKPAAPVKEDDANVQAQAALVRARLRRRAGRAGTLLTTPQAAGGKTQTGY